LQVFDNEVIIFIRKNSRQEMEYFRKTDVDVNHNEEITPIID